LGCLSQAAPLRGFGALHGSRRRLFGRSRGRLVPRTPPLHPHQRLSRAPPVAAHPDAPRGLRRLHAPRLRGGAGGRFAATLRGCGLRDADCGVAGAARSSHAPAPPCRDAQPSIAVGASTSDAPTGAPRPLPAGGGESGAGGEAHRQAARLFPVARQRRKRRHRGGEARAPRQQVTRPRPHSRRLSRHRHNAPGCGRRRVPPARHTLLMLQSLACVRTRQAGRPPALRNTALTPSHSKVRSPPPCLRFGKAEDFTREAGNLSHRFAAQSGPAPRMKSAAYPHPQWRRTPRYARLSRRRDAPRWRVGAGGRFAATLRGWASVPRTARQPEPPCPAPHEGGAGGGARQQMTRHSGHGSRLGRRRVPSARHTASCRSRSLMRAQPATRAGLRPCDAPVRVSIRRYGHRRPPTQAARRKAVRLT